MTDKQTLKVIKNPFKKAICILAMKYWRWFQKTIGVTMTDKQIIIKNCPCYYTGHPLFNCIVDDFGYRCEENEDCPIKKTFTITKYKNLFDIEEIEQ